MKKEKIEKLVNDENFDADMGKIEEFITICTELVQFCKNIDNLYTQIEESKLFHGDIEKNIKSLKFKQLDENITEFKDLKCRLKGSKDSYVKFDNRYKRFQTLIKSDEQKEFILRKYTDVLDTNPDFLNYVDKCYVTFKSNKTMFDDYFEFCDSILDLLQIKKSELEKTEEKRKEREKRNGFYLNLLILSCLQIIKPFIVSSCIFKILNVVLFAVLLSYVGFVIYKVKKYNDKDKKFQILTIILNTIATVLIVVLANIMKFSVFKGLAFVPFLSLFNTNIYNLVDSWVITKSFSTEFLIRLIIIIAIWGTIVGLFVFCFTQNIILLKISIACIYALILLALVNSVFYKKAPFFKEEIRNSLVFKLLNILLYGTAIFMFPYYVKWCGLKCIDYDTFVTVYSCVIGGLLTLGGVAWTIKKQEEERQEEVEEKKREEKIKNKPWFTAYSDFSDMEIDFASVMCYRPDIYENNKLYFDDKKIYSNLTVNSTVYFVPSTILKNTDQSNFIIEKVIVNEVELFQKNNIIKKSSDFYIGKFFCIKDDFMLPEIYIHTTDVLSNKYVFKVVLEEESRINKTYKKGKTSEKKEVCFIKLRVVNVREILYN